LSETQKLLICFIFWQTLLPFDALHSMFADRNGVCVIPLPYAAEVAEMLEKRFPR